MSGSALCTPGAPSMSFGSSARMEELPLSGRTRFLLRQRVLSIGATYDILDESKNPLFKVRQDSGNALGTALVGALYKFASRSMTRSYYIETVDDRLVGVLEKGKGAFTTAYTITLTTGQMVGYINVRRGFMGGLKAALLDAQGRPMIDTQGNLLRRKYTMRDAAGGEVARITAKMLQIGDTYSVELFGNVHPIYPLTFAVIIDFEKDS